MLLNSIVDLMNIEIELGLTFVQIAKTSWNADTKARNLENARTAFGVVARFLATEDCSESLTRGIADKLAVFGQQLADLEKRQKNEPNWQGDTNLSPVL